MIDRKKALELLAEKITDQIVVSTYSTASDWLTISDRPLNYYSSGAMGLASSHGLGLALARPERRILFLTTALTKPTAGIQFQILMSTLKGTRVRRTSRRRLPSTLSTGSRIGSTIS
jgi:hypothetical protein